MRNNFFLDGVSIDIKNNNILLKKEGEIDNSKFTLLILFEKNPNILRKIKLEYNNIYNSLMLSNHNFNAVFDKKKSVNFTRVLNNTAANHISGYKENLHGPIKTFQVKTIDIKKI